MAGRSGSQPGGSRAIAHATGCDRNQRVGSTQACPPLASQPNCRAKPKPSLQLHDACPDCGGKLRQLGEDVSETLEYVPARFKVIRTVRPKLSCACCSRIVQEPAPHRPIERGIAGPGRWRMCWLLPMYADHLPLYRQSEIYAREGAGTRPLHTGRLGSGAEHAHRGPWSMSWKKHVLSAEKLHGDDVPVPVLEPGNGKTKTGRLWTYVRDDRPPAAKRHRRSGSLTRRIAKGEHPTTHLKTIVASCRPMVMRASTGFTKTG